MPREGDPLFLDLDTVLSINASCFADGFHRLLNPHLLDSAVSAPLHLWLYDNESDVFDLAASYCFHIAMNHPFRDGNKRTGLSAAILFLRINNLLPSCISAKENIELAEAVLSLVNNNISTSDFSKCLFSVYRPLILEETHSYFKSAKAHDDMCSAIIASCMNACEAKWINPNRFKEMEPAVKVWVQDATPKER